jgi:lipopolysaccharide export system permease protein
VRISKLTKLIVGSFLGPFIATFFLTLFILVMQFVWKYVDDFVGKGLEWHVILKLLVLATANLVPLAIPLGTLLASIMSLGNMAENYELVALKSAGNSLLRIIRPLIILVSIIALGSLAFSNFVSPTANLKFKTLLWDVTQKKPALEIKEGVFYNDIDNYSIRVKNKDKETGELSDVIIYDHSENSVGNKNVLRAEKGNMALDENGQYLKLSLQEGYTYEEQVQNTRISTDLPLIKTEYETQILRMKLSGFGLQSTDEELFKQNTQMLNMSQLLRAADSIQGKIDRKYIEHTDYLNRTLKILDDSLEAVSNVRNISKSELLNAMYLAQSMIRNTQNFNDRLITDLEQRSEQKARFQIEWHSKFVLAFACLLLFFVGAPLGAIIKKGGLGLPVVISVIFFIVFHVLFITGSKMAAALVLPPSIGLWLNAFVLVPIAIFVTIKANADQGLFDNISLPKGLKKLGLRFKK